MVIGIDASRANKNHKTGTEWYSYYLIRWIAKLDKENEYILYTNTPLSGGLLDLGTKQDYSDFSVSGQEPEFDEDGYQVIKSPYDNFKAKVLKWPFKYFWTQGRMSIEMIFNRPDVLFVPAHTLPLIHPKRSVVTIHDIGYERMSTLYGEGEIGSDSGRKKVFNFLVKLFSGGKYQANALDYLRWSTNFAIKNADKIITISEFSKSDLESFYGETIKKIKVVYNGYNKFLYKKVNDKDRVDLVLSEYGIESPYIFYIGRIEVKKNTPALIEAFAILKEKNKNFKHKLVLAGDASFGYDETKYMISEFGLERDVIMPGWVKEADAPYLYNGADVFVFPSNYEGFGIPLLQAMACETPIVASNITSIPEVAGNAAVLFNPKYALSIAEALEELLNNKALQKKNIEAGKRRVKDFSWEKCAKDTLKIIKY